MPGRVMVQVINRQPLTSENRVRSWGVYMRYRRGNNTETIFFFVYVGLLPCQ